MTLQGNKSEVLFEKQLLAGLVLSTEFLLRVSPICDPQAFSSQHAAVIAECAIEYGERFRAAPGGMIRDLIADRLRHVEEDEHELVGVLLDRMPSELETHWEYLAEKAEAFFSKRKLERVRKDLDDALERGDIVEAENVIASYREVRVVRHNVIDVFADESAIGKALTREEGDAVLRFPGELGDAIGDFERGMLVSVLAPMKRGKSWWLQEVAYRGVLAGRRVLLVDLEMTAEQRMRRFYQRITASPIADRDSDDGKTVDVRAPVWDCAKNQDGSCQLPYRRSSVKLMRGTTIPKFGDQDEAYSPCDVCRRRQDLRKQYSPAVWYKLSSKKYLSAAHAKRRARALLRTRLRGAGLKMTVLPTGAGTIRDLEALLRNLEHYEGWVPDIVITDYADEFAGDRRGNNEYRHTLHEIWKGHKRIAQEYKALVVTASQSNTARDEGKKRIGQGDWAEDIRKLALIDIGISLDQTPEERRQGLMRIGVIAQRHREFDVLSPVLTLQNLTIGNPLLDGGFKL